MSLQEHVERSPYGQAVISGLIAFVLVAIAAWNLPASHLQTIASNAVRPIVNGVGLDQAWGVFAPNPRQDSIGLVARTRYADGSVAYWTPPTQGRYVEPYRSYRWWKWVEEISPDRSQPFWQPAALWVARQHRAADPTSVTLIRRWRDNLPPGQKGHTSWHQYEFFTLDVTPGMLR